jgi:uncharacterized protein (TIRG00374 family)
MNEKLAKGRTRDTLRVLPGVIVSLIALVIIFMIVDWQDVLRALAQADYRYLSLGLPVYLLGYVFRALAWRTLLRGDVPFKEVFLTMHAGYLLNNVLPLRLGELGRAFLLGRKKLGFWRVFSTILVERAFDMILASGLFLGSIPFVLEASESAWTVYLVAGVVMVGMVTLHLLARYQDWATIQFENISRRLSFLSRFGVEQLQSFFDGLSILVDFSKFMRVLVWMVISWGLNVLYSYILLLAFDPMGEILWAAFGLGTVALGVALPSSPSYIGIVEAAWIGAFSLFGVLYSTALAYALTGHLLHIIVSGVFGGYALAREGKSFQQIYAELRKRRIK